jgi:putative ABC transport system ATP-binding protein
MNSARSKRQPILSVRGLSKTYDPASARSVVLDAIDLDVAAGQVVVLLGASGSGKSTLLNLISGIDRPDSGKVLIDGVDITRLSETERTLFRRDHIGIVFQFFNLIPTLTVLENVTLPLELSGERRQDAEQRAVALLLRVGLADRAKDFPDRLSGGEQQRVAIARALIQAPSLVLADEPTGNLDRENGKRVMALLIELTREAGRTLIMASHDPTLIPLADRVVHIQDGVVQERSTIPLPARVPVALN